MAALRRIHRERSISPNASGKTALFMERFLRPVNLTSQNSASMFPPRHDSFLIQGRVTRTQGWLRSHPAHQFQPSSSNCTCDVEEQDNLKWHTIPGAKAVRYLETRLARGNG